MPFPAGPDPRLNEPEADFTIHDPFGLRRAVTPVFAFDRQDGMLIQPQTGASEGLGTSFYITPFGHQLSAMHVIADYFNDHGIPVRPNSAHQWTNLHNTLIGVFHEPGWILGGARPTGQVLSATDFLMFPVDQTKHPLAITFTDRQRDYVEPSLDLTSWNVVEPNKRPTVFLPLRVACRPSIAVGDRVMAIGYPEIESWRQSGASIVGFHEQMRGSVGRVHSLDRAWDQDRKVWPQITVDVEWKPGMSGGPVFNENAEVVGIVSRGASGDQSWSSALWLEPLPFRKDIFGEIDPGNPGWIRGFGVCNARSAVELFATKEAAEAFIGTTPGLRVEYISAQHPLCYRRPLPRLRQVGR